MVERGILFFDRWASTEIEIQDEGLKKYINLKPVIVPHTAGRKQTKRFGKADMSIVERLINKLMRTEKATGKKHRAYNTVKKAFDIVHEKTNKNPIERLVRAIENAAPREETTYIRYGGIAYHQAVDIAPQRRVDIALRLLAEGAAKVSFRSKKPIEVCLADEIMAASEGDPASYSIRKKEEIERIALSSR